MFLTSLLVASIGPLLATTSPTPTIRESVHANYATPDVFNSYHSSCACHIHYELWVRTQFDMHQILRPDLPELFATQDEQDPNFVKVRDLIRKNGNECKRDTEQLMFNKDSKKRWVDSAYSSDCGPGHVSVLLSCMFKALLLPDGAEHREPGKFGANIQITDAVRWFQLANYQLPLIYSCLDRAIWGFDAEELMDNYRRFMIGVSDEEGKLNPMGLMELDNEDIKKKIDVSPKLLRKIIWRTREHRLSEARFLEAWRSRSPSAAVVTSRQSPPATSSSSSRPATTEGRGRVTQCARVRDFFAASSVAERARKLSWTKSQHCDFEKKSRLRYLSETRCSTLVENACILGDQLFLFGLNEDDEIELSPEEARKIGVSKGRGKGAYRPQEDVVPSRRVDSSSPNGGGSGGVTHQDPDYDAFFGEDGSPATKSSTSPVHDENDQRGVPRARPISYDPHRIHALRTCGEFGNYFFTNVRHRSLDFFRAMCGNSTAHWADTLYVSTAMLAGISEGNPYHLLHLTVPAFYQLHSEQYGVCADPFATDIRYEFPNRQQEKRMNHYWRVLTQQYEDRVKSDERGSQVWDQGAIMKFWWSALTHNPPLPLGQDLKPRCYRQIVFGREPLRTGFGGFVEQKVFQFAIEQIHRLWHRPVFEDASQQRCECDRFNIREFEYKGCCSVEFDYYRRFLWHSTDADDPATRALAFEVDARNHDCDFFDDPNCLHRWPAIRYSEKRSPEFEQDRLARFAKIRTEPPTSDEDDQDDGVSRLYRFQEGEKKRIRLVLVQRLPKARRSIENLPEVLQYLQHFPVTVLVVYLEQLSPTSQYYLAAQTDVWMGATGAANAWAVFMQPDVVSSSGGDDPADSASPTSTGNEKRPRRARAAPVLLDLFPPLNGFCDAGWNQNAVTHFGGLARLSTNFHHNCEVHQSNGGETHFGAIKAYIAENGGLWHNQNIWINMDKFRRVWERTVEILHTEEKPVPWHSRMRVNG